MERALLVFNRGSGSRDVGRSARIAERLSGALELSVLELDEGDDPAEASRVAIASGTSVVIAAGGDGTVSACADAVLGTEASLGIVPCGTSNSIARALELPEDLEGACDAIASGRVRRIDAARCNARAMVLLASIGFHAETIDSTPAETKAALGKLAYVIQGIAHLADFVPFDVHIETERGSASTRSMALTIANVAPPATIWAHGAPELLPDDGLLDLTIASGETTFEAMAAAIELAASAAIGTEASSAHVGWLRCKRVRVVADPPQTILVDGDVIGTTPMEVEVVPLGLAIRGGEIRPGRPR